MPEAVLETFGLRREYRVGRARVTALDGVDLAIARGEFVAIMGPSGCGKSTLLNLLGGLDQPTAGRVRVVGHDLAEYNEETLAQLRREQLGFIFQRHDLIPALTARENIEFPQLLAGVPAQLRRAGAEALLRLVGLEAQANHLPEELSGGQQQRVGIARALANHPAILLADEPTGSLDSATAAEVLDAVTQLARQLKLTLVMVTHDPATAARADRRLGLKDGRLITENGTLV